MEITSAALLISISLVVFGITYYFFTTRHKERMAIIETGQSPDLFKKQGQWLYFILTSGMVSIGIAIGILVGSLIQTLVNLNGFWVISSSILFFLGISLILCYFILKSILEKRKD
ncbi:DUF6249 domain-containing protein [Nubsella zeaxanthinifaciens]|jgi:MFS family permease|uniref:DUF6249 domain-containing protein n=1 Tax=Nubsella zeaxanthinifaciens TaxID=392412 RepID=UPI000DE51D32|nr:DUF6249 domain-containing protein [Nubsella zeaxanthinifaciens]